jgi:uncharacterized membrane protein HdeD (DUF308 family)
MAQEIPTDIDKLRRVMDRIIHAHWKIFLAQGLVMMALGVLAAALPQISTLAIAIFIGWLFFVGGIFRTLSVLRSQSAPGFRWSLVTAVLAILVGLILVIRPFEGVLTLTTVLTVLFVIEGLAAILVAIEFRPHLPNWGWTLMNGVVNLVLAYLIWRGWPGTAAWAIGLLAGISMFFVGLSLTMIALAARAMAPD